MKTKRAVNPLVVTIPPVKFEGKPFTYFLGRNGVEFYPVSEDPKERQLVFASNGDRTMAGVIWKTLTGSEVLGRLLNI